MEGKELIIESIKTAADNFAAALIKSSMDEKEASKEAQKAQFEAKMNSDIEETKTNAELIISRKKAVAKLEASKVVLGSKQELIDTVYAMAKKRILDMTDNVYRDFIGGFIMQYAESGDIVVLAERDEKRVSVDFIKSLADKMGIALSVSSETHEGDGGVILCNKKYDKNLTLDSILSEVREATEGDTVQKLFGKGSKR